MAITLAPVPKPEPTLSPETQRRLIAVAINEASWPGPTPKASLLARIFRAVFRKSDR